MVLFRSLLDLKIWSSTREKLTPVNPCIRIYGARSGTDSRVPNLARSLDRRFTFRLYCHRQHLRRRYPLADEHYNGQRRC